MTRPAALVLGIETSCDETAAPWWPAAPSVLSSVVSSQVDLHAIYGGVVPEIAGRAHLELLVPGDRRGAAARRPRSGGGRTSTPWPPPSGPGLIGSLLVGVAEAKSLPWRGTSPSSGSTTSRAISTPRCSRTRTSSGPVVVLLVSGGHTLLVEMERPGRYRLLGQTVDDAAGEAFDKVARFLGLGYPGGPAIEQAPRRRATPAPSPSPGPCSARASISPSAG